MTTNNKNKNAELQDTAARFITARRQARPLSGFPGTIPPDLEQAYRIQDAAIDLWPDAIVGWKVARIAPNLEVDLGIDRLAGPVFANSIRQSESGSVVDMPMYVGGFAAVEAEFVAVIKEDAPADKLTWSLDEALAMVADLCIGIEVAGSPLATIIQLGPTAVVSDFGNNNGMIVGPSISDWESRSLESMRSSSAIDGTVVGDGGAFKLTGGFVRSVQFLLELTARRKRPLRAGEMIATGQTTGVHDVVVGQIGVADFAGDGRLGVKLVAAEALA